MKAGTILKFATMSSLIAIGNTVHAQYTVTIINPPGATYSMAMDANAGKQGGFAGSGLPTARGVVWSGTAASAVDLHPNGWSTSRVYGVFGGQQAGTGAGSATGHAFHALLWSGAAGTVLDLHPGGFQTSYCYDLDEYYQVGGGMNNNGEVHALLWSGTATSVVDLHPSGYSESIAFAAAGGRQAGFATLGGQDHAMLWDGLTDTYTDLNPLGVTTSVANGMDTRYQVGFANGTATNGLDNAQLWNGTNVAVNLHPAGFAATYAQATANGEQVGYGLGVATGNSYHAIVWTGTSTSVRDLHTYLPTGYTSSKAYGIDAVTGDVVGEAINTLGRHLAVKWSPTWRQVIPLNYVVTQGTDIAGSLDSLSFLDGDSLMVLNDDVTGVAEISVVGQSTLPNPTAITFKFADFVARYGLSQEIALKNFANNSFMNVDGRVAPTTLSEGQVLLSSGAANFVDLNGVMVARLTWRPINDEDPSQDGWLHLIDLVHWSVK